MKKRFLVAVSSVTSSDQEKINDLFRDKYGWWHWIDGFWLVIDSKGELTPEVISNMINDAKPNARRLVMEINDWESWFGYGPNSEEKNMFRWLKETWKK